MTSLFDSELVRWVLGLYGAFILLAPVLLRSQFRYTSRLEPRGVPFETLPAEVQGFMSPRLPQLTALGFEHVAYVALGAMTSNTSGFMALLSNPKTREWADVSVITSSRGLRGYTEFISYCSNTLQVDTNNAPIAPVLFSPAGYHVCRLPQVQDAATLYRAHRMLAQSKTGGASLQLPAPGQEVAELKRRLERYGPRQQESGYMYFDTAANCYRLTWKGAMIGAWRSIWPFSAIRNWRMQQQGSATLRSLGVAQ